MKYFIVNHVGYLYLVSQDSVKIATHVEVSVGQKIKFQDGTKVKEGAVVFVGANKKIAEKEMLRLGRVSKDKNCSPSPSPCKQPPLRSTRLTSSAGSSKISVNKKKKVKSSKLKKEKRAEAERQMEEMNKSPPLESPPTSPKSPNFNDDDYLTDSSQSLDKKDYTSQAKMDGKAGQQQLKSKVLIPDDKKMPSVESKTYEDVKPDTVFPQNTSGGSGTSKSTTIAPKPKPTAGKRNNNIYQGMNYKYDEFCEGVVKLHADYNVYVQKKDLDKALSVKTSTIFIRQLADKIYTREALLQSTPQGFMARGKGKDSYADTAALPRLDPDGIEALIQRATDEELATKKWRPRSTPADKRKAFSVMVSSFKNDKSLQEDF